MMSPSLPRRPFASPRLAGALVARGVAAAAVLGALGLTPGCGPEGEDGATVRMDFARPGEFYASPFPGEARRKEDGGIDVTGFPNPSSASVVTLAVDLVAREARGFGRTSGIFFPLTAALPAGFEVTFEASTKDDAAVFLMALDGDEAGRRVPARARFVHEGGPFGTDDLLSLLPLQGVPLAPRARYVAVVRRAVKDATGKALAAAPAVATLAKGDLPAGMRSGARQDYADALRLLATKGVPAADVAGFTVFRTDDPEAGLRAVQAHALAHEPLPLPAAPLALTDTFDGFCVYAGSVTVPVYQAGQPPFTSEGGGWVFDASGAPVVQRREQARVVVTVPRTPMPEKGYPVVLFSRTGAGGDRPLVDRGVHATAGGAATPGTGPAMELARAGFAAASFDGPHGGPRNVSNGDEQFLMFNVFNPVALRDNVRQSALELALEARALPEMRVDVSGCAGATTPGGEPAFFDPAHRALMGHSMGATIAPLTAAIEPGLGAMILSGAGGSWIENVMYKEHPLKVKSAMETFLATRDYELQEHDPFLSILQWAGEAADPPAYGSRIVTRPDAGQPPRHVLMLQGIVDTYIPPPVANATSLSLGLDLGGAALDASDPRLAQYTPLGALLAFSGRRASGLPLQGNVASAGGATATAVVVQHAGDGLEDGHEAAFQTEPPKAQYRCFLKTFAAGGAPVVIGPGGECP